MDKNIECFSENIKNYLNAKNLSMSEFANQSKVQVCHLRKYIISGSSRLNNAEKIAKAMNVDIDSLLFEKIEFERIN